MTHVTVIPELLKEVNAHIYDIWLLDACKSTLRRIHCINEMQRMNPPTVSALVSLGYTKREAESALLAIGEYEIDTEKYTDALIHSLATLTPEAESGPEPIRISDAERYSILKIIKRLDDGPGALREDIIKLATDERIDEMHAEATVNRLLGEGAILEPKIGRYKIV